MLDLVLAEYPFTWGVIRDPNGVIEAGAAHDLAKALPSAEGI